MCFSSGILIILMCILLCPSSIVPIFFSNPLKLPFPFHCTCCFHFYPLLCFQQCLCHLLLFSVLPSFVWFYFFPSTFFLNSASHCLLFCHLVLEYCFCFVFLFNGSDCSTMIFLFLPSFLLCSLSIELVIFIFLWLLILWSRVALFGPVSFKIFM